MASRSRGFHRLGIVLAAIPLLLGTVFSIFFANGQANEARREFNRAAFDNLLMNEAERRGLLNEAERRGLLDEHELEALKTPRAADERKSEFSYVAAFLPPLILGLAITLAISAAVYGLVRAIGWVIGGFTASG